MVEKVLKIGLAVLSQYRRATDRQTASQPFSHSKYCAMLRIAWVKSLSQESPKVLLWETFGQRGLTWSDLQKNGHTKIKTNGSTIVQNNVPPAKNTISPVSPNIKM